MNKIFVQLFLCILCLTGSSLADDSLSVHPRVGIFAGPQFNFYSGKFEVFQGSALCGTFEKGDGTAFTVAALGEYPLSASMLAGVLLGYADHKGTYKTTQRLGSAILPDGSLTDATAEETLDATLVYLYLKPALLYFPIKTLPFHVVVGPAFGIKLKSSFLQRERLLTPLNARFSDGTQDHLVGDDVIQSANGIRLSLDGGLGYDLSLAKNILLTPTVSYSLPITKVTSDAEWKASAFTAGLALKWIFAPEEKEIPPTPPIPLPPVEKKKPAAPVADVQLQGTTPNGEKKSVDEIVVEEIRTTERRPLLPYIFFDQGDASRPLRQQLLTADKTSGFSLQNISGNELDLYPHMLNIIGERMKNNPRASIAITGTNNGFESEKNNISLSEQRALTVKSYLTNVWQIDPKRITISSRNLPADASAPDAPEGREENRRVEITSIDRDILTPVARDEKQNSLSFAAVDLQPRASAEAGIAQWDVSVKQGNAILYQSDGRSADIPAVMKWDLRNKPISATEQPVTIDFHVKDKEGQEKHIAKEIPVRALTIEKKREERIGDMLVHRSGLIVFDFDKATLNERNKKIVDETKSLITPESRVTIVGYTDALGDVEHNKRLSLQRAQAVRDAIGVTIPDDRISVEGKGGQQLLYSNDTPEGRFYCRMVQVIIETPVK